MKENGGLIDNADAPTTECTVLDNGLTVASQDVFGQMCSIALIVGAGSAHEIQTTPAGDKDYSLGATQMMELLAFRSTTKRGHQDIMTEMENLGGLVQCISNRDSLLYCVDVLKENVEPAMDILADAVLRPKLSSEEVDEGKRIVEFLTAQLAPEVLSRDAVQRAAYLNSPLGHHHFPPLDKLEEINSTQISNFRQKFLFGQNCWLSGSGIEHKALVSLAEKFFSDLPRAASAEEAKSLRTAPLSTYTGGMIINERELVDHFVRVSVAFEIGGWHHDDLVVACVLHQLLGGGNSFSAGGPGKGMYTRLYTEVLNR